MEKNDDGKTKEEFPFGNKENTIMILNALFRHGRQDLPFNVIPGMKEYYSKMDSALKLTEIVVKDKPSIVDWLRSGLFEENECNVPLALLFIAWYEQYPSSDQENVECNFRYNIGSIKKVFFTNLLYMYIHTYMHTYIQYNLIIYVRMYVCTY